MNLNYPPRLNELKLNLGLDGLRWSNQCFPTNLMLASLVHIESVGGNHLKRVSEKMLDLKTA